MEIQSKEEYLKERIKFNLDQDLRLGHSLGFTKAQVLNMVLEFSE